MRRIRNWGIRTERRFAVLNRMVRRTWRKQGQLNKDWEEVLDFAIQKSGSRLLPRGGTAGAGALR